MAIRDVVIIACKCAGSRVQSFVEESLRRLDSVSFQIFGFGFIVFLFLFFRSCLCCCVVVPGTLAFHLLDST